MYSWNIILMVEQLLLIMYCCMVLIVFGSLIGEILLSLFTYHHCNSVLVRATVW